MGYDTITRLGYDTNIPYLCSQILTQLINGWHKW